MQYTYINLTANHKHYLVFGTLCFGENVFNYSTPKPVNLCKSV